MEKQCYDCCNKDSLFCSVCKEHSHHNVDFIGKMFSLDHTKDIQKLFEHIVKLQTAVMQLQSSVIAINDRLPKETND